MTRILPKTIQEVIDQLQEIIEKTKIDKSPLGYFAALYQKVTIQVKEGIANGVFDDGPRMEKLDVIFANRYLKAYYAWEEKKTVTKSWEVAFSRGNDYWPIVLQHLLIGMNAHINLDLGIAAAEVSEGASIMELKDDFDRINDVLAKLVNEVQEELSRIWPTLKKILKWTGKADDFFVDFSMQLARDGAWKFAVELSSKSSNQIIQSITERDIKVAGNASFVFPKNRVIRMLLGIVRIGEKGTVKEKIETLSA